jgi:hypothetical protein
MIRSVTQRSTSRSLPAAAYAVKSSGRPILITGRRMVGIFGMADGTIWVLIMATGMTGTPAASTSRATPVLPL